MNELSVRPPRQQRSRQAWARMRTELAIFADDRHWAGRTARELITEAVYQVVQRFYRYAPFLRAVTLVSGTQPRINRAGAADSRELGEAFGAVVLRVRAEIRHADAESAVRMCFGTVFGALVLRITYGANFTSPPVDDDTYAAHLGQLVAGYLLAPGE